MSTTRKQTTSKAYEATHVSTESLLRQRHHVRRFGLQTQLKATSAISGLHGSRFRGRGMDYAESRIYEPGDDIRNMDWRVTARTGRPHTKMFSEERERPVIFVVDANASMKFGTRTQFKSVAAAKSASLLAWSVVNNGDRVGLMTFGPAGIAFDKPAGGKRGMMRLIQHLVRADADSPAEAESARSLAETLKKLRSLVRPGSMVVILSDFHHPGEDAKRHLVQLRKHNDVLAFVVSDPFELHAPPPGLYGVQSGGRMAVFNAMKRAPRKAFETLAGTRLQQARSLTQSTNVPLIPLLTNDALPEVISQMIKNPDAAWRQRLKNHPDLQEIMPAEPPAKTAQAMENHRP